MIPSVSREQIAKLDTLMVEEFRIPVVMMMEQAGLRIAEFIRQLFPTAKKILLCCGKGNNGGDGISASRHLLNFGFRPSIFLITDQLRAVPAGYLSIAKRLHIPSFTSLTILEKELLEADVIVDCLLGYNLQGAPREPFSQVIEKINAARKPVVACDLPSGVDADKGAVLIPFIRASHILFLSLPKQGCASLPGEKWVADIGVPAELYPEIGLSPRNHFSRGALLKLS